MLAFTVHANISPTLMTKPCKLASVAVANQALKDTSPFVPFLTGSLNQRAHVEGDKIVYPGPYARYLYYGKAMAGPIYGPKYPTDKDLVFTKTFHPMAQAHWFEASKAVNMDKWLRVAAKAVTQYGRK